MVLHFPALPDCAAEYEDEDYQVKSILENTPPGDGGRHAYLRKPLRGWVKGVGKSSKMVFD